MLQYCGRREALVLFARLCLLDLTHNNMTHKTQFKPTAPMADRHKTCVVYFLRTLRVVHKARKMGANSTQSPFTEQALTTDFYSFLPLFLCLPSLRRNTL